MQQRLSKFFSEAKAIVLGSELKPFTLWHWRELERYQSPLIGEYGEMEFADLAFAVRVCALPPFSKKDPAKLGILGTIRAGIIQVRYNRQLYSEIAVFHRYLSHYFHGPIPIPPRSGESQSSGTMKTHPALYAVGGLLNLGFSLEEAWGQPPGLARWYIVAAAEAAGNEVNIMSTQWIEDALEAGYTIEQFGFGPNVTLEDLGIFGRSKAA